MLSFGGPEDFLGNDGVGVTEGTEGSLVLRPPTAPTATAPPDAWPGEGSQHFEEIPTENIRKHQIFRRL